MRFTIDLRANRKSERASSAYGVFSSQAATAREFGIDEQTCTSQQRRCRRETLTSSVNITVFNLGNAISASVGGIALSASGIGAISWAEAAFPLAAIGIALIATRSREKWFRHRVASAVLARVRESNSKRSSQCIASKCNTGVAKRRARPDEVEGVARHADRRRYLDKRAGGTLGVSQVTGQDRPP